MGLILDSSILISHERARFDLPGFLQSRGEEACFLAAISAAELLHGVERANTPERRKLRAAFVEAVLSHLPILEFDLPSARHHARLWAQLESTGSVIGAHDMIIAATALAGGHEVATLNGEEFSRVPNLVLADVSAYQVKR